METIGPYRVRRPLIQSPFARLVLATDEQLERDVVIKVFAVDAAQPEPPFDAREWRRRFMMEGRIMARLDHPNLLGIYETATDESGQPYHVLPFMRTNLPRLIGLDLHDDELADATALELPKSLPPDEVVRILRQVLAGLVHLHANGAVHRDVKASNVLLSARENGLARLCDFGMTKFGTGPDIPPGAWIGTLDYISPEQRRDAGSVTDRTDVYSAGVLAWRMLTGRLPGPTPPPLADMVPGLKPHLVGVITAAMAEDPLMRPNAQQFLHGLAEPVTRSITVKVPPTEVSPPVLPAVP
ncbi:hypothetical protein CU669_15325 [Paramagnetospirillum kuznetsovii]|uniref:Protein kinase domain-containing protein n=1 Tax=Paramagnetospirillum kuznetsovii TaxID=2053833 RepID=A0A364NV74_9PROT|nr:serine/threonine-protein kinase [Paramagnetospirillum kuznetsovii]RAU20962.1 hypothetical protein CU669_15325 [Paramagnetospirillum kuznetsovii]